MAVADQPTDSSSSVTVSVSSRRDPLDPIDLRHERIGRPRRSRVSMLAIDIEELQPRRVQPLHQERQEALHHLVAEIVVRLAFAAQAGGVDADRARQLDGAGIERPAVRRDKPGGADEIAVAQSREDDRGACRARRFRAPPCRGGSGRIRRQARLRETSIRPACEAMVAGAAGDERTVLRRKRRRRTGAPAEFASRPSMRVSSVCGCGFARMAAASSVMSMPTGHQVMQRPQPTQPEVPNWSIQVASLCVIHCR